MPEAQYGIGDGVWYCGDTKGYVAGSNEEKGEIYYKVELMNKDETATAHGNELEPRQTRLRESVRNPFGGIEVEAQAGGLANGSGVHYSIPAQGAGSLLDPSEARAAAEALREGGERLEYLLDDDVDALANGLEEAADLVEDFESTD